MVKNIVIGLLALAVVLEGGYILLQKLPGHQAEELATEGKSHLSPFRPDSAAPQILTKGMDFATSSVAKYAYEVAPASMSAKTKEALIGWTITSKTDTDGSMVVTLTPKNSEDQSQEYTITKGQKLYFVEATPFDDNQGQDVDKNLRDDYGIITDARGIIQ